LVGYVPCSQQLAERGINVNYYFFEHEGISFKKKACAPATSIVPTSLDVGRSG
jgi:hypothetical protein